MDAYSHIILSPGPGIPSEAGLLLEVIEKYAPTKSIFGVCLGQQAIAEVFGGKLYNLSRPMHGIATPIKVTDPAGKTISQVCLKALKWAGIIRGWWIEMAFRMF